LELAEPLDDVGPKLHLGEGRDQHVAIRRRRCHTERRSCGVECLCRDDLEANVPVRRGAQPGVGEQLGEPEFAEGLALFRKALFDSRED
jgi:hypothetical protein